MGGKARADEQDEAGGSPLRTCVVSRAQKPPGELIRFVLGPDDTIAPDLARRLPGRGVWVDATRQAVAAAVRQKAFARSLKQAVAVPENLPALIERLMTARLREAVSLANKAGLLVTGFAKVSERIEGGLVAVLIHAADAADDGKAKLDRKFKALVGPGAAGAATVQELTGPELDLAIGRSNVVHAAASQGGASQRILEEAVRLRRYRSDEQPPALPQAVDEADTGSA
jgi:predicted RNA-binding protein YlxR (DUF448 family)